jgi:hypothetical protein
VSAEGWVLLALIVGLLPFAAICVAWAADHHITTTARKHRKEN